MIAAVPNECVDDGDDDNECPRCGESARTPAIPDPDRPPPLPPGPVVPRPFVPPEDECGLEEGDGGDLAALGEREPCWLCEC